MMVRAETSFASCWERVRFLEQCYTAPSTFPALKPVKGKWTDIRLDVWHAATMRCEKEVLTSIKMTLLQKQPQESSWMNFFLLHEHQICRRDYEKSLSSLKNHIHALIFKAENFPDEDKEDHGSLPGSQKENFAIELASKYWKKHPKAKYDEVYENYCLTCPRGKILSRGRWEQILRERDLDPRAKIEKKRGPGKKT